MLRKLSSSKLGMKRQSRHMSIEQPQLQNSQKKVGQILHNCQSLRIHQLVQGVWGDQTVPTLLFSVNIVNDPTIRKRHLIVKNMTYIISNWTADEFPNVLYICVDGLNGYAVGGYAQVESEGKKGPNDLSANNLTYNNRIAALQLQTLTSTMDESDVRTYELRYTIRDSVTWQLPLNMLKLDFSIKIDGSNVKETLPLPNPLILNVQIRQDK